MIVDFFLNLSPIKGKRRSFYLLFLVFSLHLNADAQNGKAEKYLKKARELQHNSQFREAVVFCNKALTINPRLEEAYLVRGQSYYNIGQHDSALHDFLLASEINPQCLPAFNNLGIMYNVIGEYDSAIKSYNMALRLSPYGSNTYANRALTYKYLGEYEKAISDYYRSINTKLPDPNPTALINIMPCLIRRYRFDEASSYFKIYKENNLVSYVDSAQWKFYKTYLEIAADYGANFDKEGALIRLKDAEYEFSNFITSNQGNGASPNKTAFTDVLAFKGYLQNSCGQKAEAIQTYHQALLINNNQPDIKEMLVQLIDQQKELENLNGEKPSIILITPKPQISLSSPNNPLTIVGRVTNLRTVDSIVINDVPVEDVEEGGLFIASVRLKEGRNTLNIDIFNKKGEKIANKAFIITVTKESLSDIGFIPPQLPPKYYAILISEQNYSDSAFAKLDKPILDARSLKTVLEQDYQFDDSNIDTLINFSREDILGAIINRCNLLGENDNLLIFYAGHGTAKQDKYGNYDGYLVPSSARKNNPATFIGAFDIHQAIKNSNAQHILFIADACFSGALLRGDTTTRNDSARIEDIYSRKSRTAMVSGNLEPVPDQSLFIYYLIEALKNNHQKMAATQRLFDSFYGTISRSTDSNTPKPRYGPILNTGDALGDFIFIHK